MTTKTIRHSTGYYDGEGREIQYEVVIEAITPERSTFPRAWRVSGRQLRDGKPWGRPRSARHVYSVQEARTLGRGIYLKFLSHVQRRIARQQAKAQAAAEDLEALVARL